MVSALEPIARIAAERMLNSIAAGIVLTMLAWAVLRLVRRCNSGTRFAVWFLVLLAIPALPVLATLLSGGASAAAPPPSRVVISAGWASNIILSWAVIAGAGLVRIAFGLWRVHHIRRECVPVDLNALDAGVRETVARLRPKRSVSLLQSRGVGVPTAIGFFRPAVVLPAWCLNELPPAELSAVLHHEFAHLRRWDDWTNLFQKVVRAVFFFHPAVWWLENRLALEREMACDDEVLAATDNPRAYAECLVSLAEKSLLRRGLVLAQAAVQRVRHMSLRISQILDSEPSHATDIRKPAMLLVVASSAACLLVTLHSPSLIGVEDKTQPVFASSLAPQITPVAEHYSPRVVRAALNIESGEATRARTAVVAKKRKVRQHIMGPVQLAAKFNQPPTQPLQLVPVRASAAPSQVMPVSSLLLLVTDQTVDPVGRVTWTWSVWRVTVFHPEQPRVNETAVSKSI